MSDEATISIIIGIAGLVLTGMFLLKKQAGGTSREVLVMSPNTLLTPKFPNTGEQRYDSTPRIV
jgi:hypothetical protein